MLELSSKWNFFACKIQTLNVPSFLKGTRSQNLRFSCEAQSFRKLCFNCSEALHFNKVENCSSDKVEKVASSFFFFFYFYYILNDNIK